MVIEQYYINKIFTKIQKTTSCWLWTGACDINGYGIFNMYNKCWRVHRLSYIIHYGNFNQKMCILHKCDIRNCVNPNHLFIGTRQDNHRDMHNKNRYPCGEDHGNSTISEVEVRQLLIEIYNYKFNSIQEVCEVYKIGKEVVHSILNGKTWKHITNQLYVPLDELKKRVICSKSGEYNSNCKLSLQDIDKIKYLIKCGVPCTQIATQFNVGSTTIYNIKHGRTWKV